MVLLVVIINVLIALINFYIAWRVWKLRITLSSVVDTLDSLEQKIFSIFHSAPKSISKGQTGIESVRDRYRELVLQLLRVQQIFTILGLSPKIWRQSSKFLSVSEQRKVEQRQLSKALRDTPY